MMSEDIELEGLGGERLEDDNDDVDETNLGDDLLDSLDWLSQRGRDDLEALNHYGERMR